MCLGIPGQVVDVGATRPDQATIDVGGVRREVDVSLLADAPVTAGEWVLVHVGFALARIDEAEAARELDRLHRAGDLPLGAEPEAGS